MRALPRKDATAVSLAVACLLAAGCSAGGNGLRASGHSGGIRLTPDPAYASARIAVVSDGGWDLSRSTIHWSRNGQEIPNESGPELSPSSFLKGDVIAVDVTASDPATGVRHSANASVQVVNTPPRLTRVTLTLSSNDSEPVLQANAECADPDGDTPRFTYRWLRNGSAIDGPAGSTLPVSAVKRGDQIVAEVVASDGTSSSPPLRSEPLTIADAPPQFTSAPAAPGPSSPTFEYQAVAADPDGDPVTFELVSGPDGMVVDPHGHVSWTLPTGDQRRGDFPVRIRVSDGRGGEATQDFTVHLDPAPAAPAAH